MARPPELVADDRQEAFDLVPCRGRGRLSDRLGGRADPRRRRLAAVGGQTAIRGLVRVAARGRRPVPGRAAERTIGVRLGRPVAARPGLDLIRDLRSVVGTVVRAAAAGHQPAELAGPVESDQDLAEEPFVARRLAACLEDLHGRIGHGPGDVGLRGAGPVEPLRRGEQPASRDGIRVAGAAGHVGQGDVRAGPRADRHRRAGRDELDRAADLLARLGQPCRDEPIPRGDPAERGCHEPLRAARFEDEHGSPVAREERCDRIERPADRRRLPAPRCAPRSAEDRLERKERGRVATEDPAGGEVGVRQPLDVRALGRLAEHEPDARSIGQAGQRVRLALEGTERRRRPESDHDVGHALAEALDVLAEAGGHQSLGRSLEALDEAADDPEPVLEREPGVALAPLTAGRQADPAATDSEVRDPAGIAVQARGGQECVEQRQPHRGLDRRRAEVALDPLEDRLQSDELTRRMEVEELLDQGVVAVDGREAVPDRPPGGPAGVGRVDPGQVGVVDRAVTLVAAADLVAAGGTSIVLVDGTGSGVRDRLPDDLVEDHAATAGHAPAGVLLAEPDLEGGLLARGGGDRLERGVEVAHVRRPQDDLGQQPGERAGLERCRAPLPIHGCPGDPAAASMQVDDHVAEAGVRLDPGRHQLRRRWRGQSAERGEREPRVAPDRKLTGRHGPHPATDGTFRRVNEMPRPDVPLGDLFDPDRSPT